jgi:hypothetical protein
MSGIPSKKAVPIDIILGSTLAFAAGLTPRLSRQCIIRRLPEIVKNRRLVDNLFEKLATGGVLSRDASDIDQMISQVKSDGSIIAVPLHGPNTILLSLLNRASHRVACVFWRLNARYNDALSLESVRMVDLNKFRSAHSLISRLLKLKKDGYTLIFIIECPMNSRKRYQFLGYSVRCSGMIEVISQKLRCDVTMVSGRLVDNDCIRFNILSVIENGAPITQALLTEAENLIYSDPVKYEWSRSSIIFSDPQAFSCSLSFLEDILDWRSNYLDLQSP